MICDATEITNTSYKEYLHWLKTRIGEKSDEYKAALTGTHGSLFVLNFSTRDNSFDNDVSKNSYLHLAEYDDYPMVGVTLDQAKKYCQWRSNRVFEMILHKWDILSINPLCKGKNCFTTEKFLTHEKYKDERKLISHYPQYFIGSADDWNIIKDIITEKKIQVGMINTAQKSELILNDTGFPYNKQLVNESKRKGTIYDILGNVSELIDGNNQCAGGDISDQKSEILKMEITNCSTPNNLVGFRCLSKWVKIETE